MLLVSVGLAMHPWNDPMLVDGRMMANYDCTKPEGVTTTMRMMIILVHHGKNYSRPMILGWVGLAAHPRVV